jgi:hypothetical protein
MRKFLYISIVFGLIISASSCSKQCVQCQAKDKSGVIVNTSNVICEHDLNRNHFEDRYKSQFQDYNPSCSNVSN